MCFVLLLVYWYTHKVCKLDGVDVILRYFGIITNGFRQGSILSPYFFAVYIDDLSKELNKIKVRCFVGKSLVNHLLFANDLCYFCPSIHGLQRIIVCFLSLHNIQLSKNTRLIFCI